MDQPVTASFLQDLIRRMSAKETPPPASSDQCVFWLAHREAEALGDPSAIASLADRLKRKLKPAERSAVYFIVGLHRRNTGSV